jgi:uncharacterized protein
MALSKRVPKEQPFVIKRSAIQGRGGFATRLIRKGARIAEYLGERISPDEGDRRYDDDKMGRHHTFLFVVDKRIVIDAAVDGNDARYINHSCDPNCEAVIEARRVFIEALKTIQPGEELSYDYSYDRDDASGWGKAAEAQYPCHCGGPNCRGTILAPKKKKRRPKKASKATKRGAR